MTDEKRVHVLIDVTGVQRYVFGSRKLRDNVGASRLVEELVRDTVAKVAPAHGLTVVRHGGGAAELLGSDADAGRGFVREVCDWAGKNAPGIELACVVHERPANTSYSDGVRSAHHLLADRKASAALHALPELPATVARCRETGLPAERLVRGPEGSGRSLLPVCRDVMERREAMREADENDPLGDFAGKAAEAGYPALQTALRRMRDERLVFSHDHEKMRGREGHTSYLAVVHVDANGMGKLFRELATRGSDVVREVSEHARWAQANAVAALIDWLCDRLSSADTQRLVCGEIPLRAPDRGRNASNYRVLPIRPVIGAGDDLTLVSEGQLSLRVAAVVTAAYEAALRQNTHLGNATACAGVGLGHAHTPFVRLVARADDAIAVAKRDAKKPSSAPQSRLAWAFDEDQHVGDAPARESASYALTENQRDSGSWTYFADGLVMPLRTWAQEHRSQLKGLAGDLIAGADDRVKLRVDRWKERGIDQIEGREGSRGVTDIVKEALGWRTTLLQAIEMMDFLVPETKQEQGATP